MYIRENRRSMRFVSSSPPPDPNPCSSSWKILARFVHLPPGRPAPSGPMLQTPSGLTTLEANSASRKRSHTVHGLKCTSAFSLCSHTHYVSRMTATSNHASWLPLLLTAQNPISMTTQPSTKRVGARTDEPCTAWSKCRALDVVNTQNRIVCLEHPDSLCLPLRTLTTQQLHVLLHEKEGDTSHQ